MNAPIVLRVAAEGITTSFRYPHFAQGVHPTLPMPPPATIYGHICGAVGDYIDPNTLNFAYTFTHGGEFVDYEHLWFETNELNMNPFRRHLLFAPRFTLYLSYPDLDQLVSAFRSPYYPVVLGRSQDLMTYTDVRIVTLQPSADAYFEGTLLPPHFTPFIDGSTTTITLARFIDERRRPSWAQYAILRGKARFPTQDGILPPDAPESVWADPEICDWSIHPDLPRAVYFHRFVENEQVTS